MSEFALGMIKFLVPVLMLGLGMFMGYIWGRYSGWIRGYTFMTTLHEKDFFCVNEFIKNLRKIIGPENKEALDRLDDWIEFEKHREELRKLRPTDG